MDYTDIPRSLIYKDRASLNDFGVQIPGTINNYLFTQMRKLTLLRCGNAKDIALQCFNNAYYICTLIQLDEYPDLSMDKYEMKLLEVEIPFRGDVYQASMALVCVLLAAYDDKYKQKDNLLIESIHHWTSSNKWTGSDSRKSFDDIIKTCNTDSFFLHQSEFSPRDIIEVIETFRVRDLQDYAIYICERLAHLENSRLRMHGADMVLARLRDYQRELCKEMDYNPKKDCFKYPDQEGMPIIRDLQLEEQVRNNYQKSKEAIYFYMEHYPKEGNIHNEPQTSVALTPVVDNSLVAENEKLTQQLERCVNQVHELKKENAELKNKLAEFMEPVEELTAEQKVRMAFALQLLKAAGLTEEKLDQNKSKVATLIHILTTIGANNNGKYPPTQICQNWLVDKKYYPERNIDTLVELNTLCAQLGIEKAFLNLGQQSNGNE